MVQDNTWTEVIKEWTIHRDQHNQDQVFITKEIWLTVLVNSLILELINLTRAISSSTFKILEWTRAISLINLQSQINIIIKTHLNSNTKSILMHKLNQTLISIWYPLIMDLLITTKMSHQEMKDKRSVSMTDRLTIISNSNHLMTFNSLKDMSNHHHQDIMNRCQSKLYKFKWREESHQELDREVEEEVREVMMSYHIRQLWKTLRKMNLMTIDISHRLDQDQNLDKDQLADMKDMIIKSWLIKWTNKTIKKWGNKRNSTAGRLTNMLKVNKKINKFFLKTNCQTSTPTWMLEYPEDVIQEQAWEMTKWNMNSSNNPQ